MTTDNKIVSAFIDFQPNWAKNEKLRMQFENRLKSRLSQEVPAMVERLKKLEWLMTLELGEYADCMKEASEAFMYGLWRAVVSLIGIAAERFTDGLYSQLQWIILKDKKRISKSELLGQRPSERSKLAMLLISGLVDSAVYDKLVRIKELRDFYVHPQRKARNAEKDALTAMRLFRSVLKERFDKVYTIKQGKIVKRQFD